MYIKFFNNLLNNLSYKSRKFFQKIEQHIWYSRADMTEYNNE